MRRISTIKLIVLLILCNTLGSLNLQAQFPSPALVGYWHNWNIAGAPYIQLDQVDSRYNVIDVSFAVPSLGTDYKMEFNPVIVTQAAFIGQIQTVQAQGRKVIISVGGATAPVHLDNIAERDTFITTMTNIINTYGFDGFDIDLEGGSLSITGGTIAAPTDAKVINLIYATKKIMENYYLANNKKLLLTMAPETAFVQGGQSAFGGIWGAYLPVIHAMRDSMDMLHVQLYNSGSMFGIDNNIYTQGTADFIVAMVEAVIVGFSTTGGTFVGLPAHKIGVALPACASAAGGGYTDTNQVIAAVNYLRGIGAKPGSYTLSNSSAYPNLGGMMTWSVNWDAAASCNGTYQYANTYQTIFTPLPLAIKYDNFFATRVNDAVKLFWETQGAAQGVSYFEIERSDNGLDFYSIGRVDVSDTHLPSQSYSMMDYNPRKGHNYYRIRYNDVDGSMQYSQVQDIIFGGTKQAVVLYPNPAKDELNLIIDDASAVRLSITDLSGRVIHKQIVGGQPAITVSLSNLKSGLYFVQLYDKSSVVYTASFGKVD